MTPVEYGATRFLRVSAHAIAARQLDLRVEGLDHLPRQGPVLIASHHYHHLYDGCALLAAVPRPLHLLVALDWVASRHERRLMEWACRTARWPVVLRAERLHAGGRVYGSADAGRYLRRAVREAVTVLRAGRALGIFPEAYPLIDPQGTGTASPCPDRTASAAARYPFRPGAVTIAALAQRDGHAPVPIVPAGLSYQPGRRWEVTLRFAAPLYVERRADRADVLRALEERVRLLSLPVPASGFA